MFSDTLAAPTLQPRDSCTPLDAKQAHRKMCDRQQRPHVAGAAAPLTVGAGGAGGAQLPAQQVTRVPDPFDASYYRGRPLKWWLLSR